MPDINRPWRRPTPSAAADPAAVLVEHLAVLAARQARRRRVPPAAPAVGPVTSGRDPRAPGARATP